MVSPFGLCQLKGYLTYHFLEFTETMLHQHNSYPTINNILTNKQRNVKSGDSKIWLGNRPQIIDGKISESASNPPYILTPFRFVLELSIWLSTITSSTPTVPLQADSLAKAGLRLFLDFFLIRSTNHGQSKPVVFC